uniref:Uncharacterized protein n=1 Tax=Rhipicephalus zambeziensis TaxID=60191 RepID=A0A224Y7I7_9ACAR
MRRRFAHAQSAPVKHRVTRILLYHLSRPFSSQAPPKRTHTRYTYSRKNPKAVLATCRSSERQRKTSTRTREEYIFEDATSCRGAEFLLSLVVCVGNVRLNGIPSSY